MIWDNMMLSKWQVYSQYDLFSYFLGNSNFIPQWCIKLIKSDSKDMLQNICI